MLWRVQQYQPVHQSRQSSLKPAVGSANPSPEPRDHQLPAWQCFELQPRSTPRLTARAPVRKAYRRRAYQGPDSRYDRWYRTSHTAAPPSTVMNSRRLMPSSSPSTRTYHIEWKLLCVKAKWRARLPLWVKSGHFAVTRHVRFTPESRHAQCTRACLLWAKSGHRSALAAHISPRVYEIFLCVWKLEDYHAP